MDVLLGIASLAGLSLFFARLLRRSSALTPLLAVCCAMVWFMVWGVAGAFVEPASLLMVGGWLWYALCAAVLVYVLVREKAGVLRLFSPGLWFFLGGSVFFALLFFFTRPMLTQWDEFTVWGTAAKAVCESGRLYTVAESNLIARSAPPALMVFNYMVQFFGPWAEYKLMTAFAVIQLAALAAPSAVWNKSKAGAATLLGAMLALPFFFELRGLASWSFLSCMADAPMAALFGGALCFYFAGGEKDHRLLLPLGIILAALTSVKDIGLALALIAWFVTSLDLLFCARGELRFFRLKRWGAFAASAIWGLLMVVASYGLWAAHLNSLPQAIDRFNVGNAERDLGQLEMLVAGVKALLGIAPDERFTLTTQRMLAALWNRPVSLLGPGLVMLVVIIVILAASFLFQKEKTARRRVLVFGIGMLAGFVAFYVFNIFTYTYIFKPQESDILKDYYRYIFPYWFGWMMASMTLLAGAANESEEQPQGFLAKVSSLVLSVAVAAGALVLGNREANVFNVSPSLYGQRLSVQKTVAEAKNQGMRRGDLVYPIIQGDNTSRFYMLGYEIEAKREFVYVGKGYVEVTGTNGGPLPGPDGEPLTETVYIGNAAGSLVGPGYNGTDYEFPVPCDREELAGYLKQQGCTHVLIDVPDEYILEEFAPLFTDGLKGWAIDPDIGVVSGHRYYRVEWKDGECRLVPETAERGAGA